MGHSSLIKNTALLFINKVSLVLSSFILLPVFTANFGAAEYGLATLIAGYVSLLAPLLTLRMDIGIFKHIVEARDDHNRIKVIVSSFALIMLPILLGFLCVSISAGILFNIPYYPLIVGNILIAILFSLISQFSRGIGRTSAFVSVSLLVTVISFVISLLGITMLELGIEIIFISAIISQLLGIVALAINTSMLQFLSAKHIDKTTQKQLLKYSLPLVPDSASYWVMNISDRTVLSVFLGISSAGIYTVANKFSSIVDQAIGVFFQAWTESATEYAKKENRDRLYSDVFSVYMRVFVSISLVITSLIPFIFPILVKGDEFQSANLYVPILMYAMIAHAAEAFISSIYLANNLTKQIAKTTLFGAVINIIINIMLVMCVGIWAAAISTLISYLITAIYRYYNVRKYGIILQVAPGLMCTILVAIAINASLFYWNNTTGDVLSLLFTGIVVVFLSYRIVIAGWPNIKSKIIGHS